MQSVCMKEARTGGAHRLAEETTLIQLIFGGYLRSKVLFIEHLRFCYFIYSVTLDCLQYILIDCFTLFLFLS